MTVLERLKAAGYDPAVSLFPDGIGNAGSMECERIQIRTFFCRPRENEAAIGVAADTPLALLGNIQILLSQFRHFVCLLLLCNRPMPL